MNIFKYLFLLILVSCAPKQPEKAQMPYFDMSMFLPVLPEDPIARRIQQQKEAILLLALDATSSVFINVPTGNGPLGEGEDGKYDNNPLFREDLFDSTTYIETVMAIALFIANPYNHFTKKEDINEAIVVDTLNHIRYKNGEVDYLNRNHFTELDWIENNIKDKYLRDDTKKIYPRALIARSKIDKAAWYRKHDISRLKRDDLDNEEKQKILDELYSSTAQIKPEISEIPYIPLDALFTKKADHTYEANIALFNSIPSGSIINIVTPNWDLVNTIGTHINISHQAFVFKKDDVLLIRLASLKDKKVLEMPLVEYLRPYVKSPTIKGINILHVSTYHMM